MRTPDPTDLTRRRLLKLSGGTAASIGVVGTAATDDGRSSGDPGNSGDHRRDGRHDECDYNNIGHGGHGGGEHGDGEYSDPVNQYLLCPDHPHADTVAGHTMHHVNAAMGGCPTGSGLQHCDVDTENPDLERINEVWPECTPWPHRRRISSRRPAPRSPRCTTSRERSSLRATSRTSTSSTRA